MIDERINPGWFDEGAQRDPAWLAWKDPDRINGQIEKLFTETLPSIPTSGPDRWRKWNGDFLPSLPTNVDRYDLDFMEEWIPEALDYFFPTVDDAYEPRNWDAVDQFTCYLGNYFVTRCGGMWFNGDDGPNPMYDEQPVNPRVGYEWAYDTEHEGTVDDPVDLLFQALTPVDDDGNPDDEGNRDFSVVTTEMHDRAMQYRISVQDRT
ncbi:hypothetical protein [Nocardia transvalensis]|uniref:hypothetical protein n=1 Tax=Nocardia transvalensis TaxID=37333 RepID=UPI0018932971|nr:hypothetical protein [Nocardia transvalensis]MBF6328713.1 hypothetical protein [Nocardia transvalensis]